MLNPGPLAFSRPAPAGLILCSESAWESLAKGGKAESAVSQTPWSRAHSHLYRTRVHYERGPRKMLGLLRKRNVGVTHSD